MAMRTPSPVWKRSFWITTMMVTTVIVSFSFFGIDATKLKQDSNVHKGADAVTTLGTAISGGNITIECDKCEKAKRVYLTKGSTETEITILNTATTNKVMVEIPPLSTGFYKVFVEIDIRDGITTQARDLEVFDCDVCRIYNGCLY